MGRSTVAIPLLLIVLSCTIAVRCEKLPAKIKDVPGQRLRQRRLPDAALPVNLYELLGPDGYAHGAVWQPQSCYAPLRERMTDPSEEKLAALEGLLIQDLIQTLSASTGVPVANLSGDSSYPLVSGIEQNVEQSRLETDLPYRKTTMRRISADRRYWEWLQALSVATARYTADRLVDGVAPMACPSEQVKALMERVRPWPVPVDCSNTSSLLSTIGLWLDPHVRLSDIAARVVRDPGWCSVHAEYAPYGRWLKTERVLQRRPGSQRFRPDNSHKDRVVFLFDLLYELEHAFKRQHWLGAVVQQNPFDAYAIMDVIHSVVPDLIIETGTANGGSALMWASALELLAVSGWASNGTAAPGGANGGAGGAGVLPRVMTIDVNPPQRESWAGSSTRDPTANPLWAKYVTFMKGSTLDPAIISSVKQAAAAARRVLVLLDSDHTEHHVQSEAEAYCPLVTPGSYCIVEDTKLSRFSIVGGPTPGIARFLAAHPEFVVEKEREPFYTQHVGGYLRRLGPEEVAVGVKDGVGGGGGVKDGGARVGGRRTLAWRGRKGRRRVQGAVRRRRSQRL